MKFRAKHNKPDTASRLKALERELKELHSFVDKLIDAADRQDEIIADQEERLSYLIDILSHPHTDLDKVIREEVLEGNL